MTVPYALGFGCQYSGILFFFDRNKSMGFLKSLCLFLDETSKGPSGPILVTCFQS